MDIFNERFLPLIKSSGKTDQELEKSMGLPRSIIYDWKNGRNKSSFKKYAGNFAVYFNVSADYLLGNIDTPNLNQTNVLELDENERKIIAAYRDLNDEGKQQAIILVTEFLFQSARYTQKSDTDAIKKAE